MKGVKVKFNYSSAESLVKIIDELLKTKLEEDDDKLVVAALFEVKKRMLVRMINMNSRFSITLSPAQSLAMRILYTDFPKSYTPHIGVQLLQISNDVKKIFG
jgi:hypothetical protein